MTSDNVYWRKFGSPVLAKEFGAIDYIDFSPVEPHYFAVTCSVRVQIYNPITRLVDKNLSRFQEAAYGGTFRNDGRLLIAGDQEGLVKLFDVSSKNILRLFKGHEGPVHRVGFITNNNQQVASFADDKVVKVWDIASEKAINNFAGHTDYIRAGCTSPISQNILVSGGYDNKIKLLDTRTNTCTLEMDHESPVESLLMLPTGSIIISCGATEIRVWDAVAGGKLLAKVSQHHKTISCMRLASNGRRLLSGGLDHHVKVYDIGTYETVHTMTFPSSVLSLGISPNDEYLVAGMVDGLVSIQRMEQEKKTDGEVEKVRPARVREAIVDETVPEYESQVMAKYNASFRKFEYAKALDQVLLPYVANKTPHITVSVIQELMRRKGLHRALSHRTHKSVLIILRFFCRYLSDYRFTKTLMDACEIFLDCYEEQIPELMNSVVGKQLKLLLSKVKRETDITYECLTMSGAVDMLVANAAVQETTTYVDDAGVENRSNADILSLEQSHQAREHGVINVA